MIPDVEKPMRFAGGMEGIGSHRTPRRGVPTAMNGSSCKDGDLR